MITTKITIKPHLAEYAAGKFGNNNTLIRFTESQDIYHIIWDLTKRRPKCCPPDSGNLEIILPDRRIGKAPETYNYINPKSQRIIERKIENMFIAELHDFVLESKHRYGTPFIESITLFMNRYDIESITEDGLKKNCYRWINKFRKRKKRAYGNS